MPFSVAAAAGATYAAGRLGRGALAESNRRRNEAIPLSPEQGGMCVGAHALQKADILASTTAHRTSKVIRYWTRSDISHVMLYVGEGRVIEAVGEGVVIRSLDIALNSATLGVVYRYPNLDRGKAMAIAAYARQRVDEERGYDKRGAVCAGMRINCASRTDYYCSELVFSAYQHAGIQLSPRSPSRSVPQDVIDLLNSGKLDYVGHLRT